MNTLPANSLRILYLEDKARDRDLVTETLAEDGLLCELIHAATREEFESALAEPDIEVILSDYTVPAYSGTVGAAWLETGGVYVVANIRGGGEFGPAWHQVAPQSVMSARRLYQ